MVEYRNKKEERAQHQEKLRVLKKKHQPMLQLKEYDHSSSQAMTILTYHSQGARQPHQGFGKRKEEDERYNPGDREHSA